MKEEALYRKHRSEIEEIDATMKEVPELPKNFDDWVIKNCFKETLFYERERDRIDGQKCTVRIAVSIWMHQLWVEHQSMGQKLNAQSAE